MAQISMARPARRCIRSQPAELAPGTLLELGEDLGDPPIGVGRQGEDPRHRDIDAGLGIEQPDRRADARAMRHHHSWNAQ
jgi:hypothetical protein